MVNALDRAYITASIKVKRVKEALKEAWEEEKGGTSTVVIEIVMVGMILVLGYMFRKQIGGLFTSLWNDLVTKGSSATGEATISSMSNPFETK